MKNAFRPGSELFAALVLFVGVLTLVTRAAIAAEATSTDSMASSTPTVEPVSSTATSSLSTTSASSTPTTFSISTPIDVTPPNPLLPQISSIVATNSATSTVVSWETGNQVSTGAVLYGTTTEYDATSTSNLALDHSVVLTGLGSNMTYHFAISAATGAGSVTSPDQTFTTPAASPAPSGEAPAISMITVVPAYSITTVSWTTDQLSSSEVVYGTSALYTASSTGDTQLAQIPTTNHVVTLSGLTPGTTYHFAVVSQNASGLAATSSDMTFTTGEQ